MKTQDFCIYYKMVMSTVRSKKTTDERVSYLKELGYNVDRRLVNKDGVTGSVTKINNEICIQISNGTGKLNYGYCVIINN